MCHIAPKKPCMTHSDLGQVEYYIRTYDCATLQNLFLPHSFLKTLLAGGLPDLPLASTGGLEATPAQCPDCEQTNFPEGTVRQSQMYSKLGLYRWSTDETSM